MCDPLSIAIGAAAVGVATSATSSFAKQKEAGDMLQYQQTALTNQDNYRLQNAINTNDNLINQYHLNGLRLQQESEATAQQIQQDEITSRQNQASAIVSAAESGVAGASYEMLIGDYKRNQAMRRDYATRNLEFTIAQSEEDKKAYRANAQSSINSVRQYEVAPVSTPSLGAAMLNMASTGVQYGISAYGTFKGMPKDKKQPKDGTPKETSTPDAT